MFCNFYRSLYPASDLAQLESTVDYTPYDFIGNVGVLIILVTYLLLQMERVDPKGVGYSIWNGLARRWCSSRFLSSSTYPRSSLSSFGSSSVSWALPMLAS